MPQAPPTAGRFDHLRGALAEFPPLLWSFLYFFFLLTGYYVLRPVRDAVAASNDPAMVFPPARVESPERQSLFGKCPSRMAANTAVNRENLLITTKTRQFLRETLFARFPDKAPKKSHTL